MDGNNRTKHRHPKRRPLRITVRGKQRGDIDKDLLMQAVLEIGHQLQREQRFFAWLMEQDERVAAGSLTRLHKPVIMVDTLVFALFHEGHLVCCLAKDDVKEALKIPGAKLFAPAGGKIIFEKWVELPERADLLTWEQYGLAAMRCAIDCLEQAQ
jgi:hypothetical protein